MSSEFTVKLQIKKLDVEQRLATAWVAIVSDAEGVPIIDSDNHIIPVMALEKAVHEAFSSSGGAGKGGVMHGKTEINRNTGEMIMGRQGVLDVVESFVVTAEKREALGLGEGPEGWIATFRVNDADIWEKVKDGDLPELSLRGEAVGVVV